MALKTIPARKNVCFLLAILLLLFSCGKKPIEPVEKPGEEEVEPATARIVFLAEGENDSTYVYIIDGSGLQLLTEERAQGHPIAWSPDKSKLAFRSDLDGDGLQEICTVNADGTNLKQVTPVEIHVIGVSNYKALDWATLIKTGG